MAKKARTKAGEAEPADEDDAPAPIEIPEPLDEEGQMKKDAILEALQLIKTSDFTELKTIRAPVHTV